MLRAAIRSVVEQDFSVTGYEVVVVDNASTDETAEVVSEFKVHRNVRYLYEGTAGLNPARNAGWREARGAYAVYLDDDAVAESGWLSAIRDGFAAAGGKPVVIGGRVDPIWLAERPKWLSDALAVTLTIVNWGHTLRPLRKVPDEWLAGANIAIPKSFLEEIGGFDARLDRLGRNLLSNGDILIQRQAQRHGLQCLYHPYMRVRHTVTANRLTQRWFVARYYWQGISDAVMEIIETAPDYRRRVREALSRTRRLLRAEGVFRDLMLPTQNPEVFTRKCFALIEVGHIVGLLRVRRR